MNLCRLGPQQSRSCRLVRLRERWEEKNGGITVKKCCAYNMILVCRAEGWEKKRPYRAGLGCSGCKGFRVWR